MLVLFGGLIAVFAVFCLLLGWHPRRGRQLVGELRHRPDYEAMAEIEEHDTDDMLDGINAYRRRREGRDIGEELADELMRGTWESS